MADDESFAVDANVEIKRFSGHIRTASIGLARSFNRSFRGSSLDKNKVLNNNGLTFEDIEQEMRLTVFLAIKKFKIWKEDFCLKNPSANIHIGHWINFVKTDLTHKHGYIVTQVFAQQRGMQFSHVSGEDADYLFYGISHSDKGGA